MQKFGENYSTLSTPQSEQADSRQVPNSAGGFTFEVDKWDRFRRFLVLGSDKGSYYAGKRQLVRENAKSIEACIDEDGIRAVDLIVELSDRGVPNNDTCLFALALAAASERGGIRQYALNALPKVARIGTHLFHFAEYVQAFRGWGRALKSAIARWYTDQDLDRVAYQIAKYPQRDGWTHGDLLRLSHPVTDDVTRQGAFRYALGKEFGSAPEIIEAAARAKFADKQSTIQLIEHNGLTREMVQTKYLKDLDVQWALLQRMPLTAMIRNLGNMSKSGLLKDMSDASRLVIDKITDVEYIRKSRVHPYQMLVAGRVYGNGQSVRGSGTWDVASTVVEALDDAFYMAFDNIEPTGARTLIGLDVSGSMRFSGDGIMMAAEKAAAMCMVTAKAESVCIIRGFSDVFVDLGITRKDSLRDVMSKTAGLTFSRTDCALPMTWAQKQGMDVDAFIIYTDSETWAGSIHPHQALASYRKASGNAAKLVVVGMESNDFTIADPSDAGMLDVVGFDASAPKVIADFIRS